jgi:hypothetical protein
MNGAAMFGLTLQSRRMGPSGRRSPLPWGLLTVTAAARKVT